MRNDRCRDCGVSVWAADKDENPRCQCCKGGAILRDGLADGATPPIAGMGLPAGSVVVWLPQASQARLSVLSSTLSWAASSSHATPDQIGGTKATADAVLARDATKAYGQLRDGLLSPEAARALRDGLRLFVPPSAPPAPETAVSEPAAMPAAATAAPSTAATGDGRLADAVAAMGEIMFNGGVVWAFTMEEVKDAMVAKRGFTQAEADAAETKVWKGAKLVDLNSSAGERTIDSLDEVETGDGTAHKVSVGADVMAMLERDAPAKGAPPEVTASRDARPSPEEEAFCRRQEAEVALLQLVGQRPLRDCPKDDLRGRMAALGFVATDFEAAWTELWEDDDREAANRGADAGKAGARTGDGGKSDD